MSQESSQPEKLEIGARSENLCGLKSRLWQLAVAGGTIAVLLWFLLMPRYPFLVYVHQGTMFAPDPGEVETIARYKYTNPAILFAAVAGSSAIAFAIAEGLARRSTKYAALGMITGGLLSSSIGAAGGWLAQWVFDLPLHRIIDLAKTMMVQATCWSLVGLGVGLGFSLPVWRRRVIGSATLGAVAGGLLAALLYGPVSAIVAQMSDTDTLVPQQPIQRLVWLAAATVFMGCVAAGLAQTRKPSTVSPDPLPPAGASGAGA